MKLQEMYEAQLELDRKILEEHPLLFGENRLEKKVLALQVELSEVAQEWRGFKFWSHNQSPTEPEDIICYQCDGSGYLDLDETEECLHCEGYGFVNSKNALLEEYVDCIHFMLSIGNDLGVEIKEFDTKRDVNKVENYETIELFLLCSKYINSITNNGGDEIRYRKAFRHLIILGIKLGFYWKEVEEYYFKKNAINHERQENNY